MTAIPDRPGGTLSIGDLRIGAGRRRREAMLRAVFLAAAGFSIVISLAIILTLAGNALNFIVQVDPAALFTDGWFPRRGLYDLLTPIAGTLVISVIGMLVAAPLGIGAAIYLSEYASIRARKVLKPIIEILAAIPSVVLGFFALAWISPNIVQAIFGAPLFNMLAAGIAVGILITPLVASVAEDALHAVPQYLREAAYGLGARRRTTSLQVVVPAAVSGIVAALILGVSRAIGETMIVSMVAGATGGSLFNLNPLDQGQTMTAAMTALAIGSDQVRGAELTFESLYFLGFLLFLMTFALNLVSDAFVRRVRRRY
ncbi:MAG TPA: phosphate ABC transporter permease subunit PstC [Candidatus Limnocylindria bacterium]|nr:phosphate ABC transporter permease subunit PstC [Candidatus Limnocylindria bacterium]